MIVCFLLSWFLFYTTFYCNHLFVLFIQQIFCYRDIHSLSKSLGWTRCCISGHPWLMSRWCGQGIFHHPIRWSRGFGVWRLGSWVEIWEFWDGSWLQKNDMCFKRVTDFFCRENFKLCCSCKLQVTKCLELFILFCWFSHVFCFSTISVHREPSKLFNRMDFV